MTLFHGPPWNSSGSMRKRRRRSLSTGAISTATSLRRDSTTLWVPPLFSLLDFYFIIWFPECLAVQAHLRIMPFIFIRVDILEGVECYRCSSETVELYIFGMDPPLACIAFPQGIGFDSLDIRELTHFLWVKRYLEVIISPRVMWWVERNYRGLFWGYTFRKYHCDRLYYFLFSLIQLIILISLQTTLFPSGI